MDDSLFLNFFFSANFHSPTGYDLSSNNLKSCLSVKKKWSDSFLYSNKKNKVLLIGWGLFSCAKDRMREKTCVRKTENKISRKSILKKKQLPFNYKKSK